MTEQDKERIMQRVEDALCAVSVIARVIGEYAEKSDDKSMALCAYDSLREVGHAYLYDEIERIFDLEIICDSKTENRKQHE